MRRYLVSLIVLLTAACADHADAPSAPSFARTATSLVPYVIQFTGDIQSHPIYANLNPADPLKQAVVDLRLPYDSQPNGAILLPTASTELTGAPCDNADPAVPNTWGAYGGVDPSPSSWQGIFWLDRPTGKGIRTWFGIEGTMTSSDAAGVIESGVGPASLAFVVHPGTEVRTKDTGGRITATVTYTNVRAGTVNPLSYDHHDRCVSYTVTAQPR